MSQNALPGGRVPALRVTTIDGAEHSPRFLFLCRSLAVRTQPQAVVKNHYRPTFIMSLVWLQVL